MLTRCRLMRPISKTIVGLILSASLFTSPIAGDFSASAATKRAAGTTRTVNKIVVKQDVVIISPVVNKKPYTPPKKDNKNKDNSSNSLSGSVKISTTAAMKPLAQDLVKAFNKQYKKVTVSVFGGQAGIGILDVSNNRANIGIASKELSKEETADGLSGTRIGIDIIAMVVNSSNRIHSLSTSDIFNIYTRTITNWKEVRGKDAAISFNTYSTSNGLGSLFDSVYMHGQKMSDKVTIHSTTGSMLNTIKLNKNAIGYASLSDIKKGFKILNVNGIAPTAVNAKSGKYPFSRNINMVTKGTKSAATNAFIQFTLSPDGQKIINKYCYRIR